MDIDYEHGGLRRLEVVDTGRRRRWTVAAKVRIVEESLGADVSVSSVARRHGMAPSQLFGWRRQLLGLGSRVETSASSRGTAFGFTPVVVQSEAGPPLSLPSALKLSSTMRASQADGHDRPTSIIVTARGVRIEVMRDAAPELVTAMLGALAL
jgi:transposase-like protein